ncbi:MAG: adenylate/guanylate cyclase domain-containing protein [Reyranellaceae bacterium]
MNTVHSQAGGAGLHDVAMWLLREGWRYANYRKLFEEIAMRLLAQGIPLWRMGAYVPTLDPELLGDAFVWRRAEGRAQYITAPYSLTREEDYQRSPLHEIARTKAPFRRRLSGPDALFDYPLLHELRDAGATDYFGLPMPFADDTPVQITFATDSEAGFADSDLRAFTDVALVLGRLAESFAVRMRVERLLATYIGRDAGKRVMAGQILRGSGDTIEAAILFADLRDFTALSESLPRDAILQLLNDYFDLVGKAVTAENGEILKFVGDGVLAIFPVTDGRAMAQAALAALRACHAIGASFEAWNAQRESGGLMALGFGIAVHGGEVMYGNVGASGRLDFTAIGPVVNTVSRLQGLCRELGQSIVVSRQVRDFWPAYCAPLASRALRGMQGETEIFALLPQAFKSSAAPGK